MRYLHKVSAFTKFLSRAFFVFFLPILAYAEDFEKFPNGELKSLESTIGTWTAEASHAEIQSGHARSAQKALHIRGGKNKQVLLKLKKATEKDSQLAFWAERWTRANPFSFTIEAKTSADWEKIYTGDKDVKVGAYHAHISLLLPTGTSELRFTATSPDNSGVLIDDLKVEAAKAMTITSVTTVQPVIPALIRKKNNAVLALKIVTEGRLDPPSLRAIEMNLKGTSQAKDIRAVRIFSAGNKTEANFAKAFADEKSAPVATDERIVFTGNTELQAGENFFWISVELDEKASLDHLIDAEISRLQIQVAGKNETVEPVIASPPGAQRIGYALRMHGDDGSKAYRIPGLATSKKGTLLGVYDVRYRGSGDLPGDIDVGLNRSTDGGQTWEKMQVIMDMGDDPKWSYDGIGDPSILVDENSDRIWVGALWSHGNNSWNGSGQGMTPEKTGQLMLVYSDDDGLTWSKPRNITEQVKKKNWHLILFGPGRGITMADGTLVFPAQYQDESKNADGRKKAFPLSTILWSKDQGETWNIGTGIKGNTTEAQVVQLSDGSLMLNCRDNRGGFRTIGTTTDLGKTWTLHPTDRKALPDPVCMASLLRVDSKKHGSLLVFSNPATQNGRYNMTLKISTDEGMTWPENHHFLYDSRPCSGYSCLTSVGKNKVGVLYEGPNELYFLRFTLDKLLK